MNGIRTSSVSLSLALLLSACGAGSQSPATVQRQDLSGAQVDQHKQLVTEGDAAWEQRADRAKLEEAIRKWEQAIGLKQDDADTYAKLARAVYVLTDGYLAFEGDQVAYLGGHQKAMQYAERGLMALSPEVEKRVQTGVPIEDAVQVLGREGVPLMYWYATNLGKWAKAKDFATTLKNKDRIFKIVTKVYELDRDFYYGAADRYFGAFYSVAPAFAGGDVEKSRQHFEESIKRAPNYLATYVLMAELYAPKAQDPELFDRHLAFVMQAPDDILPGMEAETQIEKKKAERLMQQKADLF